MQGPTCEVPATAGSRHFSLTSRRHWARLTKLIVMAWALVCKACNRTRYGRWGGLWSRWLRATSICRRLPAAGPGPVSDRFWRVTDAGGSRVQPGKGRPQGVTPGAAARQAPTTLGMPRSLHLNIMSGICALEHVALDCRAACSPPNRAKAPAKAPALLPSAGHPLAPAPAH